VLVVMGAGSIAELPRRLLQTMGDAR